MLLLSGKNTLVILMPSPGFTPEQQHYFNIITSKKLLVRCHISTLKHQKINHSVTASCSSPSSLSPPLALFGASAAFGASSSPPFLPQQSLDEPSSFLQQIGSGAGVKHNRIAAVK
uniref:Uncharacterized protein n=1 Tax=Odontella aurita TaxID=265563 RepID=A0A7S4NGG8_9STRA|mmetsp:Transcript_63349/g.187203  ORF Transcript_63349/g.187203 Transcript_63349/m.187203 type:complete len:116 (+) Transcript_63349:335-682(+)